MLESTGRKNLEAQGCCFLSCLKLLLLLPACAMPGAEQSCQPCCLPSTPLFPVPAAPSFSPTGQGCWHCPALRARQGIMNSPHMFPMADRTGHQHHRAPVTLAVLPLAIPAPCERQPCRSSHAKQSMQHHGARPVGLYLPPTSPRAMAAWQARRGVSKDTGARAWLKGLAPWAGSTAEGAPRAHPPGPGAPGKTKKSPPAWQPPPALLLSPSLNLPPHTHSTPRSQFAKNGRQNVWKSSTCAAGKLTVHVSFNPQQ